MTTGDGDGSTGRLWLSADLNADDNNRKQVLGRSESRVRDAATAPLRHE